MEIFPESGSRYYALKWPGIQTLTPETTYLVANSYYLTEDSVVPLTITVGKRYGLSSTLPDGRLYSIPLRPYLFDREGTFTLGGYRVINIGIADISELISHQHLLIEQYTRCLANAQKRVDILLNLQDNSPELFI